MKPTYYKQIDANIKLLLSCIFIVLPIYVPILTSANSEKAPKQQELYNPKEVFSIKSGDIVLGDPESSVVVFEYSAPTCPSCAYYHLHTYKQIKSAYVDSKKIAYVIRPLVWSQKDLDAATLVKCSPEKSEAFIDIVAQNQTNLLNRNNHRDMLSNLAMLSGLGHEGYKSCLEDASMKASLVEQNKRFTHTYLAMTKSNAVKTPSIIVNGDLINGNSFENISQKIEEHIKKSSEAKVAQAAN